MATSVLSRVELGLRTPSGKLALVAIASTALTAVTILSTQAVRRRTTRKHLRKHVEERLDGADDEDEDELADLTSRAPSRTDKGKAAGGRRKKTNEVIIREALARNYAFFGDEGMAKIRESFVVVVGLGGVGSATAAMLVRSGVRKIRLVDFDQVSLSSLNVRLSFRSEVGGWRGVGPELTFCFDGM